MRDSIGGLWVLIIVLTFMVIFIAFISITINYSTAYQLKSKMITVIEQYEGMNNESLKRIDGLIRDNSYKNKLTCHQPGYGIDNRVYGITDMNFVKNPSSPQSYCVSRDYRSATDGTETQYYYTVTIAFAFNLPVLGDILNLRVSGETNGLLYPNDIIFD